VLNYVNCFKCNSNPANVDGRLQLLSLGVFSKLLQKIESPDVVSCVKVMISVEVIKIKVFSIDC